MTTLAVMTRLFELNLFKDFDTTLQTHNSYPNCKNLVVKVVGWTFNGWLHCLSTNKANPNDNSSRNDKTLWPKLIHTFEYDPSNSQL